MGKTVTWIGDQGWESWRGFDGDQPVMLNPGETVQVSDDLAAHLQDTFPGLVDVDGKRSERPATPDPDTGGQSEDEEQSAEATEAAEPKPAARRSRKP